MTQPLGEKNMENFLGGVDGTITTATSVNAGAEALTAPQLKTRKGKL